MLVSQDVLNILIKIYSVRKYNTVLNIFNSITELREEADLANTIEDYLFNIPLYTTDNDITIGMDIIISDFIVDNIITKLCGIVPENLNVVDIYFLAGLLEFYSGIEVFNTNTTIEIRDILDTDEISNIEKIGMIVRLYQTDYYALDAFEVVDTIPDVTIESYKASIEQAIQVAESDVYAVYAMYSDIADVDSSLLATKLFIYIVTNNAFDITETLAIAYINNMVDASELTSEKLAKELVLMGVILQKDQVYMEDLVTTMYSDFNTTYIIKYVNSKLGRDNDNQ